MIDVHTHMLRPHYWGEEYARNWSGPYGGNTWKEPDAAAFDAAMQEAGIELAVVFGIRASAAGVRSPTSEVAAFCKTLKTPSVVFMALDPRDADWRDQFDEGLELGVRGIKLYPVMARFDPRDPEYDAFYGAAVEHNLPILWHMGATPSAQGILSVSHPLVIDEVARRFPELRQIIAHMGHPWQRDTVQVLRKNRNVVADISGMWTRSMDGYLALVNAQEWGVVGKLVFGSDYPLWTPQVTIDGLRKLTEFGAPGFPRVEPETIETILSNDTRALLGL